MQRIGILITLAFMLISMTSVTITAQDAAAILKKMDDQVELVKDKSVVMTMVLKNLKSGKEQVKEANMYQKGSSMKLFRYTAPQSDAGIATLSLPNNEIYIYLPMFKKPKKVTNLAESRAVNKSDFSIDEMAAGAYSDRYTAEMISDDGPNYVLDLKPIDPKSDYSHVVVHINKTRNTPVQMDYHDKNDVLFRQSMHEHEQVDGLWVAKMVSMENFKREHKTTLFMFDIKVNQGLSDDLFALENLATPK